MTLFVIYTGAQWTRAVKCLLSADLILKDLPLTWTVPRESNASLSSSVHMVTSHWTTAAAQFALVIHNKIVYGI